MRTAGSLRARVVTGFSESFVEVGQALLDVSAGMVGLRSLLTHRGFDVAGSNHDGQSPRVGLDPGYRAHLYRSSVLLEVAGGILGIL